MLRLCCSLTTYHPCYLFITTGVCCLDAKREKKSYCNLNWKCKLDLKMVVKWSNFILFILYTKMVPNIVRNCTWKLSKSSCMVVFYNAIKEAENQWQKIIKKIIFCHCRKDFFRSTKIRWKSGGLITLALHRSSSTNVQSSHHCESAALGERDRFNQ